MDLHSAELLRGVQTGDQRVTTELFERSVPRLQALVQAKLNATILRRMDSDDIVQSAMKSFFVRAGNGDFRAEHPGDLWRLLATITMRKVSRATVHHRAAKRDVRQEAKPEAAEDATLTLTAQEPSPAEVAAAFEEVTWLMRHIAPEVRQALQLRMQGYEFQEIGRQLDCSERTVRRWMDEVRALMLDRAESLADVSLSRWEGIARELQCDIPSAEPGELLDPHNYVLQRLIGSGGVSKVYAATQRSTGQLCCVKVLRREFRHKARYVRRFVAEYRVTRKLAHENIVATQGMGRLPDGGHFLVMDLIGGVNLQKRLQADHLPPIETARIMAQVSEAVAYAHRQGIIHCDLTPVNVLIDDSGKAWLTDFGFAREMQSAAEPTAERTYIAGTPAFLAQEQYDASAGPIGIATDVHGLGAILFAALTGKPPYAGRTLEMIELCRLPMQVDCKLLAGVPTTLIDICQQCMQFLPAKRFANASSVEQALLRAIEVPSGDAA